MTQENVEQDLQFIKKALENNRKMLADNGIFYILWGIMVVVGIPISYIFINMNMINILPFYWLGLAIIFFFIQLIINKKTRPTDHVDTFGWKLFNAVWRAVGITCILLTILFFTTSKISVPAFIGIIAAIFGIAYYLSGIINDIKFLTRLSYVWWLATIIGITWEYMFDLYYIALFFAGLILFLQVIPGIIIHKKWKRDYAR
jgi:hypothetical protein